VEVKRGWTVERWRELERWREVERWMSGAVECRRWRGDRCREGEPWSGKVQCRKGRD
jgi:hypothetical protein